MDLSFAHLLDVQPTESQTEDIKQLVYESLDLYEQLPIDFEQCMDLIASEVSTEGTECFNPMLAMNGAQVVGVICHFSVGELELRQRNSMLSIMRLLDRKRRQMFRQMLAKENYTVAGLPTTDGVYISRVAISNSLRRSGVGSQFLKRFIADHPAQKISLHVDQNNVPAIGLYQQFSFKVHGNKDTRKVVMQRPSDVY